MDDDVREELRLLRARAYGPHGDITDDATAVARLRELEDLERQDRLPPAPRVPSTSAGRRRGSRAALVAPDDDEDEDGDDGDRDRPALVGSKRRLWIWAASLAVVAALASAGDGGEPHGRPRDRRGRALRRSTPSCPLPTPRSPRSSASAPARSALTRTTTASPPPHGPGSHRRDRQPQPCLYLLDADEVGADDTRGFRGNFVYGGCGAGVFPATVQFVVADGMPDAFVQQGFPIGTSMQFVFDGGERRRLQRPRLTRPPLTRPDDDARLAGGRFGPVRGSGAPRG